MFRRLPIIKYKINIIPNLMLMSRSTSCCTLVPLPFQTPRFSSTSSTYKSPVDVENWTLDEAIVKRHQQIQEKWLNLSNDFSRFKRDGDNQSILTAVDGGLKLFDEVGADDSPVHCRQMLWMTKAQAHLNRKEFDAAFENAKKAYDLFVDETERTSSPSSRARGSTQEGSLREVREFLGFVQLERGNFKDALEIFDEMLSWVAEGSRKSLPMVQVLAINMKRTLQTGKARALYGIATAKPTSSADGGQEIVDSRALIDQSLDLLIESLSAHVDEKDVESAKMALDYAALCYCAVGDFSKAEDACDKLEGWCRRHGDEAGLALAETRRKEIELLTKQK